MKKQKAESKLVKQMTLKEMLAPFNELRFAVLATVEEGKPYTSIIAVALKPNNRTLFFTTSSVIRKHINIINQSAVFILLKNHSQSADDIDSAQAVTLLDTAKRVRTIARKAECREIFVNRHPELADFINDSKTALITVTISKAIHVAHFSNVSSWP